MYTIKDLIPTSKLQLNTPDEMFTTTLQSLDINKQTTLDLRMPSVEYRTSDKNKKLQIIQNEFLRIAFKPPG